MFIMTEERKIELLIEALKVLTKDEDERERKALREMLNLEFKLIR
jgi:PleD family two-component response regulator